MLRETWEANKNDVYEEREDGFTHVYIYIYISAWGRAGASVWGPQVFERPRWLGGYTWTAIKWFALTCGKSGGAFGWEDKRILFLFRIRIRHTRACDCVHWTRKWWVTGESASKQVIIFPGRKVGPTERRGMQDKDTEESRTWKMTSSIVCWTGWLGQNSTSIRRVRACVFGWCEWKSNENE